ncbi:MAG: hypothetical protein KDD22_04260, partial [Bdellovibrionales bacterium]|nr:hypothetical protein [Bdellovibrionales bacterium]
NMEIEISKLSRVEGLSEQGLALKNPVPLIHGLIAHFYLDFPGSTEGLEVYGKVHSSLPHPSGDKSFLVYFSFFGINKNQLTQIRKYLSQQPRYTPLEDDNREKFSFNPDNLFLTDDEKRLKSVIVIDSEASSLDQTLGILREDIDQVQAAAFDTYTSFLKTYLEDSSVLIDPMKIRPLTPNDFFGGHISWSIDADNHNFLQLQSEPGSQIDFLTVPLDEFLTQPQLWKQFFSEDLNGDVLAETFSTLSAHQRFSTLIFTPASLDTEDLVALDFYAEKYENQYLLTLRIAKPQKVKDLLMRRSRFSHWDLLIVDSRLLGSDPDSWIENMQNQARRLNYIGLEEKLKVIVLASNPSQQPPEKYKNPAFVGLCYRPMENRNFIFNVSQALESKYTVYHWENLRWTESVFYAQVAKKAHLIKMSEFGATIEHPKPIAPGTFLFLRGSIFDQAPRKNLCARFYNCEEDPNDKNKFHCQLIYFGINEAFNKYARSWFRETYATAKMQAES